MTDTAKFSISTVAPEPILFDVDGELFELHTIEELTPDEASQLRTMSRREQILNAQIEKEESEIKIRAATDAQMKLQDRLFTMMTTMPEAVLAKLNLKWRGVILQHINKIAGIDCPNEDCTKNDSRTRNPLDALFCLQCGYSLADAAMVEGEVREIGVGEAVGATQS